MPTTRGGDGLSDRGVVIRGEQQTGGYEVLILPAWRQQAQRQRQRQTQTQRKRSNGHKYAYEYTLFE